MTVVRVGALIRINGEVYRVTTSHSGFPDMVEVIKVPTRLHSLEFYSLAPIDSIKYLDDETPLEKAVYEV